MCLCWYLLVRCGAATLFSLLPFFLLSFKPSLPFKSTRLSPSFKLAFTALSLRSQIPLFFPPSLSLFSSLHPSLLYVCPSFPPFSLVHLQSFLFPRLNQRLLPSKRHTESLTPTVFRVKVTWQRAERHVI